MGIDRKRLITNDEKKLLCRAFKQESKIYVSYVIVGTNNNGIIKVAYCLDYITCYITYYQVLKIYGEVKYLGLDYRYVGNPRWSEFSMFLTFRGAFLELRKRYLNKRTNSIREFLKKYKNFEEEENFSLLNDNEKQLLSYYLKNSPKIYLAYIVEDYVNQVIVKIAFKKKDNEIIPDCYQIIEIFGDDKGKFAGSYITVSFIFKWYPKDMYTTLKNALNACDSNENTHYNETVIQTKIDFPDPIKIKKNKIRNLLEEKMLIPKNLIYVNYNI